MTFSTASDSPAQAQIRDSAKGLRESPLTQSRETGDVVPSNGPNDTSIAKQEASVAKPWAHFVAGGYVHPNYREYM